MRTLPGRYSKYVGYVAACLIAMLALAILHLNNAAAETCPTVERLKNADARADALADIARGDRHLLMLGGFVGVVPGGLDDTLPTVMIEGTEDTSPAACQRLRRDAEDYAYRYNETIRALRN